MDDAGALEQLTATPTLAELDAAVARATDALLKLQRPDGHWVFELEADATIPAEYVLLRALPRRAAGPGAGAQDRRLPAPHPGRARRLAALSRRRPRLSAHREGLLRAEDDRRRSGRAAHGPRPRGAAGRTAAPAPATSSPASCWRSSASSPGAPCRRCRSRSCCCRSGSRSTCRKISYWARTVIVPLLVLRKLRPRARESARRHHRRALPRSRRPTITKLARGAHQKEPWASVLLRPRPGAARRRAAVSRSGCSQRAIDKARRLRRRAAERRGRPRRHLPGHGQQRDDVRRAGLSAPTIRDRAIARASVEKLLVVKDDEAYCQPCFSPVWDTALAAHALLEAGAPRGRGRGACAAWSG